MPACRIAYFANTDWYLFNFRAPLALAARKAFNAEIHCLCPDGPYRSRLQDLGFYWSETPMERQGANPMAELALLRRVRRVLRETKPDLLHNFTLKSVIWGTRAAQAEGVPCIVNALAGMGSVFRGENWKNRLIRPVVVGLLRHSLRHCNQRVIFQNPDDLHFATECLGVDLAKAILIRGSGVNTARFTAARQLPLPAVVLFVGRLLKDKGLLEFCASAAIVQATHPQVSFRIAGTPDHGNPSSLRETEIAQIALRQPYLQFLGHIEDMPSCYQGASLAVLPSYGEGVPRSLIEAASCGLPLVTTDVPGCREIVKDGHNGFIVPPRDHQALADAILRLIEDPERMASFGRQGHALVEAEFSEASVLDRTLDIYRALLLGTNFERRHS